MAEPATGTGVALGVTAKGLKWAWDHQDEIEPRLKNIFRAARRRMFGRHPGILILGPGGVGKTTLGRILSGKYDFLFDTAADYDQSVRVQTFRSKKNPNVELVVAPGQEDRRPGTWNELLGRLSGGKELGVILCCAYGYHALAINHKHHELYQPNRPKAFLPAFLQGRRAEELRVLSEITAALQQNPKATWLLTLVAKEDLWTDDDASVRSFYEGAEYAAEVQKIAVAKGKHRFRHEIAYGSLIIRNFIDGRGVELARNQSGYDQLRQVRSLRQIFESVAALEAWKAG